MDGTMVSGGPSSFDALQLHPISRQHPIMVGPISVAHPHVTMSQEVNGQQHCLALGNPRNVKAKLPLSDDEERSEDGTETHMGKKGSSLWHRMKWTDDVVRLLIRVVSYVGEDADCTNDGNKRKAGILQKKGKWKSVSRFMVDNGYNVSPQQCEDKFNDLNKRYKRLNDVLGRGTACDVVENPSLLDGMDLSPKMKEGVRKILSSKHLFYREMCAYHNGGRIHAEFEHSVMPVWANMRSGERNEAIRPISEEMDDEENEDEDTEDEEEDEENEENEGGFEFEVEVGEFMKKPRMVQGGMYGGTQEGERLNTPYNFSQEIMSVLQEGTRTEAQKLQWMRNRTLQLAEQKLVIQARALVLEQQCMEWKRLKSKKDREFERFKLENERMIHETEQLILQLKKKELGFELKRSDASSSPLSALHMDQMQRREQHDMHSEERLQ